MATQQQFIDMLRDIEPAPSTVEACASAHRTLRSALEADETFKKVLVTTFLSGSYRRDTAIRPALVDGVLQRPDVDVIVVTSHTKKDRPKEVLSALEKALRAAGYENIKVNRRSICVTLKGVDMDIVPVIEEADAYLIPDVELKEWLTTNPPAHTQWTVNVNTEAGGRFKPLVKLFKSWRRVHLADLRRPKGFILECLVAKHMNYFQERHEPLFVTLLEAIRDAYALTVLLEKVPFLEDPGVPGNNVFSSVKFEEFKKFYDTVKAQADLARKAMNEEDQDKQLELWRKVFGPRFPATGKSPAASASIAPSLLRAAVGAGLTFPATPVLPNKPAGFA
jgi:hypothetical protein